MERDEMKEGHSRPSDRVTSESRGPGEGLSAPPPTPALREGKGRQASVPVGSGCSPDVACQQPWGGPGHASAAGRLGGPEEGVAAPSLLARGGRIVLRPGAYCSEKPHAGSGG